MDDAIARQLKAIVWEYADKDPAALTILRSRIEETGRKFGLISYSDIVKGVEFRFPNMDGRVYRIDTYDWSGLDRRIVGDFLGYLSMESYLAAGFFCSALVIARLESKPSDIFFEWIKSLGILPNTREDSVLAFWSQEVRKAHHWYKYQKQI